MFKILFCVSMLDAYVHLISKSSCNSTHQQLPIRKGKVLKLTFRNDQMDFTQSIPYLTILENQFLSEFSLKCFTKSIIPRLIGWSYFCTKTTH